MARAASIAAPGAAGPTIVEGGRPLVAQSRAMRALVRQARRYAGVDATVFITGETGVGKDALARFIHASGPRRREPFVTLDCPALASTLVEAELFGYERGAFTDATTARPGRFEMAGRGTIYLDAVTGLSPAGQGALLRLVEERRVTRLGGTVALDVRGRLVASAQAGIEDAVREGSFRAELFHRLHVLPMHIPSLRERPEDILPLARRLLAELAAALQRPVPDLAPDAEDALRRYRWPGNVRELRHVLERALVAGVEGALTTASLPSDLLERDDAYLAPGATGRRPTLDEVERRYIELTLHRVQGNQTKAAAILGISRKALWEKRKRYGLQ
ncbi:MAG: sigma-54-dependent Fis family transcriptional regulator [Acidobacteria bacterium]|nr:sigma-54-dependent Fis family transcriptional regulator [Acidobacteriota bacterium]